MLATHLGVGTLVAELTSAAMGGTTNFEDALAARLDLMRPSRRDVEECIAQRPNELSPGIQHLISLLHARGTHVYIISGGFRQMIAPVAEHLGIPIGRVFANNLMFTSDGAYAGFDDIEPTSRAGGKAKVIAQLRAQHGYETVVMVGDGATDMQARPPATAFIGYGGVAVRDVVRDGADLFVLNFAVLEHALAARD
jgi:phosphoserine phosphatase